MIIRQIIIILSTLFIGYEIAVLTHIPVPANVMGLVLLFLALVSGLIKLKDVEETANFILKYLALFFVVPTVGIMVYFDLLAAETLKIFVPIIVSILLGLLAAGRVTQFFINRTGDDYKETADHLEGAADGYKAERGDINE